MRRSLYLVAFLFVLAACAFPARAQAPSSSEALARLWNDAGGKVIEMAEDFPEDKYDFKPAAGVRSFAEQLLHVAGGNYLFMNLAQGKPPGAEDLPREKYKTKAEIVAALKKSVAEGAALIRQQGDAGLDKPVKFPWSDTPTNGTGLWAEAIEHVGEHYGQLVVYYRVNGLVPPASRR
jgi:uncharacterized damage-inducible protein DinB